MVYFPTLSNLIQKMRYFALTMCETAETMREQARLLKRLKTTNKEIANYNNYIHYITIIQKVRYKKFCSFQRQKNYKKLQKYPNAVLKTTNKKV